MDDKNEIKLVLIGYTGGGKTCLMNWFKGKPKDLFTRATVNADYYIKEFMLEGQSFTVNIWDTAGVEMFMSLVKIFLKDAKGVFIVYDITRKDSFDKIDEYIKLLKEVENNDTPMIIIGNKCDLKDGREITVEEGELKAKKYGADYIETSAVSGENIEKAFEILMRRVTKIGTEDYYKSVYGKLKKDYNKLKSDNDNNILKKN